LSARSRNADSNLLCDRGRVAEVVGQTHSLLSGPVLQLMILAS
jgi:hypothetical protein